MSPMNFLQRKVYHSLYLFGINYLLLGIADVLMWESLNIIKLPNELLVKFLSEIIRNKCDYEWTQ